MNGEQRSITDLLNNSRGFSIPVYQREYQWRQEQCKQLYDDLVSTIKNNRSSHFFGSIVDGYDSSKKNHYIIIDGQQRITTISILLLAIRRILTKGILTSNDPDVIALIDSYLIEHVRKKKKLTPAHNSVNAYDALFNDDEENIIPDSKVTFNYKYFYDRILHRELTIDELLEAIERLSIIDILLEKDDDAQLIFESLNSTGLDLSESDKIRNYILMSLKLDKQEEYYHHYWNPIEENTIDLSDAFFKDYLTIKLKRIPTQNKIYEEFKHYSKNADKEELLKDLKKFSKHFQKIIQPQKASKDYEEELTNLKKLDITVARPFIMELLDANSDANADGYISNSEVKESLNIIENYLLRRAVSNLQTTGLNKVFTTLYKDTVKISGNEAGFVEKLKYIILSKEGKARIPDDDEFSKNLEEREMYTSMNDRYLFYLLERLDRFDNHEVVDIEKLKAENRYSIEHVMPQTLSPEWINDLGGEELAHDIHKNWLHRLANLTLTGYNPTYSNNTFSEKRNMEHGYKQSPFFLTRYISEFEQWTENELNLRNDYLIERAFKIWQPLTTSFVPEKKFTGTEIVLSDDINLIGRDIVAYKFNGVNNPVKSWKDFYVRILQALHKTDTTILTDLALKTASSGLEWHFTTKEHAENSEHRNEYREIDENIYVWAHNDTNTKINILCKVMDKFEVPYSDVVLTLSNQENKMPQSQTAQIIYRFWEKALPILNESTPLFSKRNPSSDTWRSAGANFASGVEYTLIFNSNRCSVGFDFNSSNIERNLKYYDLIYQHKDEIEEKVGINLYWIRNDNSRRSCLRITNKNLNILDESCWDSAISFMNGNLTTLYTVLQPILDKYKLELNPQINTNGDESARKFWGIALPLLKERTPLFQKHIVTNSNWITASCGKIAGMQYVLYFTNSQCYVGFEFNSRDISKNIACYDYMYQFKDEIEKKFGESLIWSRHPEARRSSVEFHADQYHVSNENTREKVANLFADKTMLLYSIIQPIIERYHE